MDDKKEIHLHEVTSVEDLAQQVETLTEAVGSQLAFNNKAILLIGNLQERIEELEDALSVKKNAILLPPSMRN